MTATIEPTAVISETEEGTHHISRAALALHHMTAGEEDRPVLTHAWFLKGRFQAADGYIAGMVKPVDRLGPAIPEQTLIPRKTLQAAITKTTKAKPGAHLTLRGEIDGEIVTDAKPDVKLSFQQPGAATPPDVHTLVRDQVPHSVVMLNANLLKRIATFLATAAEGTDGKVEVRMFGCDQAVEFRTLSAEGEQVTALVMPMVHHGDRGDYLFDGPTECPSYRNVLDHHIAKARAAQSEE